MKTVLVTGANRGIGREVAGQLAARTRIDIDCVTILRPICSCP
ncbi:MAG: hypothetical protein QOG48_2391 [Verrucomicrobiota bacterium]|jgi:NAD(P)-dependent dehydrogenase (short-subunit alcohol dehydrogenase family)